MNAVITAGKWVRSPRWDALWLFSGLWAPALSALAFVAFVAVAGGSVALERPGYDVTSFALIYLPLAVMHRISTTWSVLATPILREQRRAEPWRYVPLLILLGCVGLGLAFAFHERFDGVFASYRGRMWAYFALAYVMVLWERWHFCAQEFGVLSIYRIRAGQHAPADKRFDRFFTVALMLGVNMVLFVCFAFADERHVLLYGTVIGAYPGDALQPIGAAVFLFGLSLFGYALLREWHHPRRSLPKLLYYALIGGHTLILFYFPRAIGLFFLSYVFHHWMVAVGLFGLVAHRAQPAPTAARRWLRLAVRFLPWLLLSLVFYESFAMLDKAGNLSPLPDPHIFAGASVGARVLAGGVVGVFFAFNYLHYYYDRCFYRFSTPGVRAQVAPLLFGHAPASQPAAAREAVATLSAAAAPSARG
jgi:hypothetical protein